MIDTRVRRVALAAATALVLLIAGACAILRLPTTTRQGINYSVTAYRVPVYVKAIDFVHRHLQYRQLVDQICAGKFSNTERLLAIFDWAHANVRRTPERWTIVDDHVLNIIIRGHGMPDQIADVFVTLSVYGGVPAFFKVLRQPGPNRQLVLSFAQLDGEWRVFDVERRIAFRNRSGELARVDDLLLDRALVDEQTHGIRVANLSYSSYLAREQLSPFTVPHPLRATLHQPWPRLRNEMRKGVGWHRE